MIKNPLMYFVTGAVVSGVALVVVARDRLDGNQPTAQQATSTEQTSATSTETSKPADDAASTEQEVAAVSTTPSDSQPAAEPKEAEPAAPKLVGPSFDIVRVEDDGSAVIAGRADPGSEIALSIAGETIGEAVANERGEWVVVPTAPLKQGAQNLIIVARTPTGELLQSDQIVSIDVPETSDEQALIVLSKPDEPTKVLQKPETSSQTAEASASEETATAQAETEQTAAAEQSSGETAQAETSQPSEASEQTASEQQVAAVDQTAQEAEPEPTPEPKPLITQPLTLDTVDYNDAGDIIFSGQSSPGGKVRIYVDNAHVGDAQADASGNWLFRGRENIPSGVHTLRIDQIQLDGQVVQRRELPFERAEPAAVAALHEAQKAAEKSTAQAAEESAKQDSTETVSTSETATATLATQQDTSSQQASDSQTSETTEAEQTTTATVNEQPAAADQQTETKAEPEPQQQATAQPTKSRIGKVVIQPGNNLWNISRVIYGRGIEYTTIYEANKDQIRNPHRIYPGQIFSTPGLVPPEEIDPKRREPLSAEEKQS